MKKIFITGILVLALGTMMLSACGGGGGTTTSPPTTAVLTLSSEVTGTIPATTTINSYQVTVTLPAGVTVKSTNPPQTDDGVVTGAGNWAGTTAIGLYTAATTTPPQAGTVKITIGNGVGFSAGEFSIVNCDIAPGTSLTPSDFTLPTLDDATGWDSISNSTVPGLASQLTITVSVAIH